MQPYPRAPDLVWPGHLHGTGCLSARAVGTGFPTVGLRLWLGPGCGWSWVLFTPARCGWGLGWVCLGSVCGVVPLLPAVCGVRGWALVWACFPDLCGFLRVSLAPRRFRFRCAVWAPGSRLCPALLGWVVGLCFLRFFVCFFFFFPVAGCPCPGPCGLSPVPFLSGAAGFFFFFFGVPFFRWAAVAGLVLPVLAGWSPCACLGVLSVVPSGWGVWPPSVLLVGGLVAVGCFRAPAPQPLFFFFFLSGGGACRAFPPVAFPRLAVALWLVCGVVGPSPLLAEVPVCYSPPLLAGFRCRWLWAVPATPGWGLPAAVVSGVWRWCVGGVVAGVWCGWSLASPGGGSCVLLPATPGWVSLPVVLGGPRHSWLGSVGGVAVWCVVCGGGVLVGLWLVCGVVGPSPLLAEVPVCYSPPLLAGFRFRWWWAVPATPGWGPLAAVVCGVWRWCVGGVVAGVWCGWSLATPGGGSCVLLPATPGWVSLPVVVGGPRHSWLGSVGGVAVWCVVCGGGVLVGLWLVCGVVGPSPLLAEVPVCYSPPLLAGFRFRWLWAVPATPGWGPLAAVVCGVWQWCVGGVVAGVWCGWSLATPGGGSCVLLPATPGWVSLPVVVGGPRHSWLGSVGGVAVWCVVCGGGVLVGLWLVCGVVGPSPLLAEVPVCYSPPLLAGFRFRWWWAVPATPGWGPLAALLCGVWCVAVVCWWGCGWCVVWLVPRHSWRRFLCATPRHSWLGFAAGGGGRSPPLLAGVRLRRWCVVCGVWCVAVVCWWGCGWCVVWLVPRHSWRRFLCATPRHSWLGFASGGGGRSPPLLAGVRWRRCCVVCGVWRWCVGGVVAGVWCGWSLATPGGGSCVLLPATPGWVSLPVVVGGPRHSWLGSACGGGVWCVVCGVWRWCVGGVVAGVWCGWSLATPGGGSCVLLPATPGWVSLPLVVGGPRHSWLGSFGGGGVWCVVGVPRHSWRRFLWATPRHSWLGFAAAGGGRSPPLLAGVRWCGGVRVLLGRIGRAGLPGALWCASPFPLAALSFCFAWPPPGWGCPPLLRCCCRSSLAGVCGVWVGCCLAPTERSTRIPHLPPGATPPVPATTPVPGTVSVPPRPPRPRRRGPPGPTPPRTATRPIPPAGTATTPLRGGSMDDGGPPPPPPVPGGTVRGPPGAAYTSGLARLER